MFKLFAFLINSGIVTIPAIPDFLSQEDELTGFPKVTGNPCRLNCSSCIETCPTEAISSSGSGITLDRGACISCSQCLSICPEDNLVNDLSVSTYAFKREELLQPVKQIESESMKEKESSIFGNSIALRVVSTGCSACDLELQAASNPIFDMERFGVNVVASPRFADAMVVTGPVPKAMHDSVLSCYEAMADPRIVIACGTCAISGGVHKNGYTEANGLQNILPVDLFIPGCPPHPWQLIRGILAARKFAGSKR